jgi:Zn-dependent membrane protease YugP
MEIKKLQYQNARKLLDNNGMSDIEVKTSNIIYHDVNEKEVI